MVSSTVPKEMQAQLQVDYNKPYELKTIPVPKLQDEHDILVKVEAAGYCHTDGMLMEGQWKPEPFSFPHIGSHEFVGTVTQLAPALEGGSLRIGDRVGVPGRSYHPCGECFECRDTSHPENATKDYSMFCPYATWNGMTRPGGFAEYALVDSRQVAVLPEGLDAADAAPMMCAGITIFAAIKKAGLSKGDRIGIIGCGGGLGHLGLQFAEALGYKTTGFDAADGALKLAKSLGTSAQIIDARTADADAIKKQLGKEDGRTEEDDMGLDAVVLLPESQRSFDYGMKLLRNHGTIVVVSFPEKPFQFQPRDLVFRDIKIVGTLLGGVETIKEMLDLAAKHDIKPVKKTFPLAKLNDLVGVYHKAEGGKLVVDMRLSA